MKKLLCVLLLGIFLLSSCGANLKTENNNLAEQPASDREHRNSALDGYSGLLDEIASLENKEDTENTVKCGRIAVTVLNWTEEMLANKEEIREGAKGYVNDLSKEERDSLFVNFERIDAMARHIMDGTQGIGDFLSSSGIEMKFKTYSSEKYEIFSIATRSVLI